MLWRKRINHIFTPNYSRNFIRKKIKTCYPVRLTCFILSHFLSLSLFNRDKRRNYRLQLTKGIEHFLCLSNINIAEIFNRQLKLAPIHRRHIVRFKPTWVQCWYQHAAGNRFETVVIIDWTLSHHMAAIGTYIDVSKLLSYQNHRRFNQSEIFFFDLLREYICVQICSHWSLFCSKSAEFHQNNRLFHAAPIFASPCHARRRGRESNVWKVFNDSLWHQCNARVCI